MKNIIIVAMTYDRIIGKDNKIPWNIKEDIQLFKTLTTGNTVIMGRKTYDSIGKPLKDRNNIVISRSMPFSQGILVCKNLEDALKSAKTFNKDNFIIGGATVYESALPLTDKIYISYVKERYNGDTYFPKFNQEDWDIESMTSYKKFSLVKYSRRN